MPEDVRSDQQSNVELDPSWSPLRRVLFGAAVLIVLIAAATPFLLAYGEPAPASTPPALPSLPDVDFPNVCANTRMPMAPNGLVDMVGMLVRRFCD